MTKKPGFLSQLFNGPSPDDEAAAVTAKLDADYYANAILDLPSDAFATVIVKIKPADASGKYELRTILFPANKGHPLRSPNHPLRKSWLYQYSLTPEGNVWLDFNPRAIEALLARPDLMDRLLTRARSENIPYFN